MKLKDDLEKDDNDLSSDVYQFKKAMPYKIYYDFYEDTWIGYLPSFGLDSSKESSNLKIELSLALETFKTKGVTQIETDIRIENDILTPTLANHNYEYLDSERLVSRLPLNKIKIPDEYNDHEFMSSKMSSLGLQSKSSFLNNKMEPDFEENVISFLTDRENVSKESLRSFFDYLKKNPDKIISQTTLMNKEVIQGYTMVVRTRWDKNTGILSFLEMVNSESSTLKELIIAQTIQDCKNHEIDLLEVHIRDDVLEKENLYQSYGFVFHNLHRFQLIE
ncbi:MAG: hypothetical protein HeimC2_38430 [Candidatus Heimdallarchaeota archaeon LC_2]|nr:MAG: hypothetical protein HeimC2_38430 [Candidatus Heimdallarchaeota archaeon LC_2]